MTEQPEEKKMKTNYSSNSHKDREKAEKTKREPVEKVITGEVVQRKKPLSRKIAETFTGDDMHSVGHFILFDVILPAAKAMISDAASQGVERMLFGDSRRRNGIMGGSKPGGGNHTSYNRMYSDGNVSVSRSMSHRARASHDFDEIVLATRGEAEDVLDRLGDLVDNYDVATVSDLYDLVGITGNFTDDKWGWTDLRGSDVRRVREGYMLILPKTQPID